MKNNQATGIYSLSSGTIGHDVYLTYLIIVGWLLAKKWAWPPRLCQGASRHHQHSPHWLAVSKLYSWNVLEYELQLQAWIPRYKFRLLNYINSNSHSFLMLKLQTPREINDNNKVIMSNDNFENRILIVNLTIT